MTIQDQVIGALCAWRENRGGGTTGMQSVFNVLMNRAELHGTDVYTEATARLQFSAMTAQGDPETTLFAHANVSKADWDAWEDALTIAGQAANDALPDITGGAVNYYALTMATPPFWVAKMTKTCVIEGQAFYK
jgi:hypothetical protein